ncbi:DUF3466 family protein [Alteromonas sp. ASW11-130]|uniref:DUF3466 family protein n=1 Tax=Alteromonas sp. ASW11-130 TaxID=3015775 RepID=UPI002241EDE2|nr:DUF3466 family protein [Alteromonas sp. ASW11-130]MCW8092305.1 DUF3466 family protein [Alteromonas sp. ASW11-130]
MKIKPIAAALLTLTSLSSIAATYSITPLPVSDKAKSTFANSIDNSGTMLVTTSNEYNPPIDIERLEQTNFFTANESTIESEEDIKNGIFSDVDYTLIVFYLTSQNAFTLKKQNIAQYNSYSTDLVEANLIPGFDNYVEKFQNYSKSVNTIARDSVEGNFIVGYSQSPFEDIEYTDESGEVVTYTVNDTYRRAFVQVGSETTALLPEDTLANGISEAYAVNNIFQAAGYSSTLFSDEVRSSVKKCSDDETRSDLPEEVCIYNLVTSDTYKNNASKRATIWQLTANGEVVARETFPLTFEPENNKFAWENRILDINNNGIAVGWSHTGEAVSILYPESQVKSFILETDATYFANGETKSFLTDKQDISSRSVAINDAGWITGTVFRAPNEIARERFFIHNIETNETHYPEGFFVNAGVIPLSINNNNVVVGKADIEASNERNRETHAFMYNIDADNFVDLNQLTSCDTNYTLVEAVDINDNNEIIANARMRANDTYFTGNDLKDEDGNKVAIDKIVAVKLTPIENGQVESCEAKEEQKYERAGASNTLISLLGLSALFVLRRRKPF